MQVAGLVTAAAAVPITLQSMQSFSGMLALCVDVDGFLEPLTPPCKLRVRSQFRRSIPTNRGWKQTAVSACARDELHVGMVCFIVLR